MPKLSATLSKKVPMPGLEYSSQQFSCGLEMELSGEQTQDSIRQNIRKLYVLLHAAIDEEIQGAIANPPAFTHSLRNTSHSGNSPTENKRWGNRSSYGDGRQNRWSKPRGGSRYGNGANQSSGRATQAQVKAIFAISRSSGIGRNDLLEMLEERFNVSDPEQLSVRQASKLIETMKENGGRE